MGRPATRNRRQKPDDDTCEPTPTPFPYDTLLNSIEKDFGESIKEIIHKAFADILTVMKNEDTEDPEQERVINSLLNDGQVRDERFALLVNLCKKIVDYGSDISNQVDEEVAGESPVIEDNAKRSKFIKLSLNYGNTSMLVTVERKLGLDYLLQAFCDQVKLDFGRARFKYKDRLFNETQSADDLEMEHGDVIEVIKVKPHCKACTAAVTNKHYTTILEKMDKDFGDKTPHILDNAINKIMSVLQKENKTNSKKSRKTPGLLKGPTNDKRFSLLVNLSEKVVELGAKIIAMKQEEESDGCGDETFNDQFQRFLKKN